MYREAKRVGVERKALVLEHGAATEAEVTTSHVVMVDGMTVVSIPG